MQLIECQGLDKNGEEISEVICQNNSFEHLRGFALAKCIERGLQDVFWVCLNSNWSWAQLCAGDKVIYYTRP